MAFCTGCGSNIIGGAAFCEECGKPVATQASIAPILESAEGIQSAPLPATPRIGLGKLAMIGGAVVAILCGAAAMFLVGQDPELPNAQTLASMAIKGDVSGLICFSRLDHSKEQVVVEDYDTFTQRYMEPFSTAGLYDPPATVEVVDGFFKHNQKVYKRTPLGASAVRNGKLCFADGLIGEKVTYGPPDRQVRGRRAAVLNLGYQNRAPWSQVPAISEVIAKSYEPHLIDVRVNLVLLNTGWAISNPENERLFAAKGANNSASSGWFNFGSLFGSNSTAIMGKWVAKVDPLGLSVMEFKPDSITMLGGVMVPVTYEQQGDLIVVRLASLYSSKTPASVFYVKREGDDLAIRADNETAFALFKRVP